MTVAAVKILNMNRNGFVKRLIKNKIREKIVVPDPHCFENTNRNKCRFHNRKNYAEEVFSGPAPSTSAASSISIGIDFTNPENINTARPAPKPR